MLAYFGYGTNRDHDMMAAMIGREGIEGKPGKMLGHELVIQKLENISKEVLPNAPLSKSPYDFVQQTLGDNFELYITRPNPEAVTYGTIWQLTEEEYEYVRDWELLDFGMQEDYTATAIDEGGEEVEVHSHGSLDPNMKYDRIIAGNDYEIWLVPKEEILRGARRARQEYLDRIAQQ